MTYELRLERLFDAPPEVVFDTLVDPDAQEELFADQVPGVGLVEVRDRSSRGWHVVDRLRADGPRGRS